MKFSTAFAVIAGLAATVLPVLASPIPAENEATFQLRNVIERRFTCMGPDGDCAWYRTCLESKFKCGSGGYPLGYGEFYCKKFKAARSQFSSKGKTWVDKTMYCLQESLVGVYRRNVAPLPTCDTVRKTAFNSHPNCYVNSGVGVCSLPVSDWNVIRDTIGWKGLLGIAALKQAIETGEKCAKLWGIIGGTTLIL